MPELRDAESRKAFVKQLRSSKFERIYDLAADDSGRKLYAAMGIVPAEMVFGNASVRKKAENQEPQHLHAGH